MIRHAGLATIGSVVLSGRAFRQVGSAAAIVLGSSDYKRDDEVSRFPRSATIAKIHVG